MFFIKKTTQGLHNGQKQCYSTYQAIKQTKEQRYDEFITKTGINDDSSSIWPNDVADDLLSLTQ